MILVDFYRLLTIGKDSKSKYKIMVMIPSFSDYTSQYKKMQSQLFINLMVRSLF